MDPQDGPVGEAPPTGDNAPEHREPTQPETPGLAWKSPAKEVEEDVEEEEWDEEPRRAGVAWPIVLLIALLTLLIGLAAGFYSGGGVTGKALVSFAPPTPTPQPTATSAPAADIKQILAMLVGKTRHWKGNANAPVVMLEFSDYQ